MGKKRAFSLDPNWEQSHKERRKQCRAYSVAENAIMSIMKRALIEEVQAILDDSNCRLRLRQKGIPRDFGEVMTQFVMELDKEWEDDWVYGVNMYSITTSAEAREFIHMKVYDFLGYTEFRAKLKELKAKRDASPQS